LHEIKQRRVLKNVLKKEKKLKKKEEEKRKKENKKRGTKRSRRRFYRTTDNLHSWKPVSPFKTHNISTQKT